MIVYADILITLNIIVDYFLLLCTSKILKRPLKPLKMLLGSVIGGISSLYIFLPSLLPLTETLIKLLTCFIITLTSFGFKNFKQFIKSVTVLFCITCAYGGIMIAVWHIFKPYGMVVNNSVVYFDISPVVLVFCTVTAYLMFVILSLIFKRSSQTAGVCEVKIFADEKETQISAILDTGNSIKDSFGNSEIIITDSSVAKNLFGEGNLSQNEDISHRYRLIPCNTVSGDCLLEAFRCDKAEIQSQKRTLVLDKPIIAISKTPINDGYNAIINPEILD